MGNEQITAQIRRFENQIQENLIKITMKEEKYQEYKLLRRKLENSHKTLEEYRMEKNRRIQSLKTRRYCVKFLVNTAEDMSDFLTGKPGHAAHYKIDCAVERVSRKMQELLYEISELERENTSLKGQITNLQNQLRELERMEAEAARAAQASSVTGTCKTTKRY